MINSVIEVLCIHFLGLLQQTGADWVAYTEIYHLTVLEAGSPKGRCWLPLVAVRENLPRALPWPLWLLAIFGAPWLIEASP